MSPPPQSKVHSTNKMHETPTIRLCRNTYFVPKVFKKTPITLKIEIPTNKGKIYSTIKIDLSTF
jgi:hypothetical protein